MIEVALQILLILAYLAIGLVAVTFAIFALCATYLKEEKRETEIEHKRRLRVLQEKIALLTTSMGVEQDVQKLKQIKAEIKSFEGEKKELEIDLEYLTAKGSSTRSRDIPCHCIGIRYSRHRFCRYGFDSLGIYFWRRLGGM